MEKSINDEKVSALQKQGIKGATFGVEVIVDKEGSTTYILRTVQGVPVRVVTDATEVAEFLNEVINEIKNSYERKE